jgi:hypothetical protein
MTDIPAWLRNFRIPTTPSTPPPVPTIECTSYFEDTSDHLQVEEKPRNVRRVSSFFSISRAKTPSHPSLGPNTNPPVHLNAQVDEVWQNSDETQIVETLKVSTE